MSRKIAFDTLGCKLNQYETDSIASQFLNAGYDIVPFTDQADIYVINTCTVTNKADRKSRNLINRALRSSGLVGAAAQTAPAARPVENGGSVATLERPDPLVVVTGCFAESHKEELEAEGLTYVVDNKAKSHIFELVEGHFRGEVLHPGSVGSDLFSYTTAEPVFHTRSMVKIQDGCDNYCTFCIIPYVRGHATSRPADEVLQSVRETVRRGYREVVLTGVNMSRYRWEDMLFGDLIEQILAVPGDFRLRISSLEPDTLDDRFFEMLHHPKMAPHLHLCVQSGSERILLKMRRQYTLAGYEAIVDRIRREQPGFNITTDIIVGFPGEEEQDFQESCRIARNLGFGHIHTFKYSVRRGTRAERMPGHVPEKEKSRRSEIIRAISEQTKRSYRESLIGSQERMLVERIDPLPRGYGEHYVPIQLNSDSVRENEFIDVRITGITAGDDPVLLAEPVERRND